MMDCVHMVPYCWFTGDVCTPYGCAYCTEELSLEELRDEEEAYNRELEKKEAE